MLDAIQKKREILTRREKFQTTILLVAIIAMAFALDFGIASVLP